MYDDEPPLTGEYLRAICIALSRNSIRSLKGAAIVSDPEEQTVPKMLPASERRQNPQLASAVTLKPATYGHFKTGHFGWLET